MVGSNQKEWDLLIPYALWAYKTAVHATTKKTPFFIVYGREVEDPTKIQIKQWMETHRKADKYTITVAERLKQAYQHVIVETKKQKKAMKAKWDKIHIESSFRINDVVWYKIG